MVFYMVFIILTLITEGFEMLPFLAAAVPFEFAPELQQDPEDGPCLLFLGEGLKAHFDEARARSLIHHAREWMQEAQLPAGSPGRSRLSCILPSQFVYQFLNHGASPEFSLCRASSDTLSTYMQELQNVPLGSLWRESKRRCFLAYIFEQVGLADKKDMLRRIKEIDSYFEHHDHTLADLREIEEKATETVLKLILKAEIFLNDGKEVVKKVRMNLLMEQYKLEWVREKHKIHRSSTKNASQATNVSDKAQKMKNKLTTIGLM